MTAFLQQLVNGLSLGSIYALIALGYTMVYGIIKLINFAHGDIYMLGAYCAFLITTYCGLGFIPALLISMVFCGVVGVLIERIAYKPLRHATRITALITAIGVSYVLEYATQYIMGSEVRTYPKLLTSASFHLGPVTITMQQVYIFVITVILMVVLQFIVQKTKMGRAMRAVSVDEDAARLMGIDVDKTISFTFLLGSALAGVAGVLVGIYYNSINPLMGIDVDKTISFTFLLGSALAGVAGVLVGIYYNSINPLMGMTPGLKAFIAAVFGGIGSIPGAMIGGLFIGIAETMVTAYGSSLYKDAIVYIILILILILKPAGLLGKNVREKV